MGIYANATAADTQFYLTRLLPGEAGKTLVLQFFDTGDASTAGEIQVLPPPDSNVSGGTFTSCRYTAPPGNSTAPVALCSVTSVIAVGPAAIASGANVATKPSPAAITTFASASVAIAVT